MMCSLAIWSSEGLEPMGGEAEAVALRRVPRTEGDRPRVWYCSRARIDSGVCRRRGHVDIEV